MHTDTTSRILAIIRESGSSTPGELSNTLRMSTQSVHRHLLKLQERKEIEKHGTPPNVIYVLHKKEKGIQLKRWIPSDKERILLQKEFMIITPKGEAMEGADAFIFWCNKRELPPEKTFKEYEVIRNKYTKFKKGNYIDGIQKMHITFDTVFPDEMYYLDFYQIDRFGRTKLGTLMLYAKQNQDKALMKNIANIMLKPVQELLQKHNFDAVCYIPPTVKRTVQFMSELRKNLEIPLPEITLKKIRTKIVVPQKTLNKLEDRIINARTSIHATQQSTSFKHILLIDDAIGSGATMNEAARILKEKKICKKITGLGITGSPSGFEVISEV